MHILGGEYKLSGLAFSPCPGRTNSPGFPLTAFILRSTVFWLSGSMFIWFVLSFILWPFSCVQPCISLFIGSWWYTFMGYTVNYFFIDSIAIHLPGCIIFYFLLI